MDKQQLNNHVSSIFEAFEKASDINHKHWEINQTVEKIKHLSNKCSSCNHWMIKQQCLRETDSYKVTCNEPICSKFSMQKSTENLISENEDKLVKLQQELKELTS